MSSDAAHHQHAAPSGLTRTAVQATLHCLTGCAIGEVLGMVIATALGLGNAASIALAVVLAFAFGYALTLRPVLARGVGFRRATRVALASDTVSIATMEIVDNAFILLVPGAIAAGLADALFWWSLARQPRDRLRADGARQPVADRARTRSRRRPRVPRATTAESPGSTVGNGRRPRLRSPLYASRRNES